MSNELFRKLMEKKGADEEMDPNYKQSKMQVLKDLHDEMSKMMAGDLHGLKKVTVAAPDQEGLQEGLAKAQDLMGKGEHLDDDSLLGDDDHEHEADEPMMSDGGMLPVNADEDEKSEDEAMDANPDAHGSGMSHIDDDSLDAMSPEELKMHIKKLQSILKK